MTASAATPSEAFRRLQSRLAAAVTAGPSDAATVTVLVVPSLSVDRDVLRAVPDMGYFEHRMLYLLRRLHEPDVRVVLVTSRPVSPDAVDYLLGLTPGVPASAHDRLTLLTCPGGPDEPLAARLLRRPDILGRIRTEAGRTDLAYLECFTSTEPERDLALALGIPLFGPEPALTSLGLKSRGRALLRELGLPTVPGIEGIHGTAELAAALEQLAGQKPGLAAAVVKLDDSLGGLGNAIYRFAEPIGRTTTTDSIARDLPSRLELALPLINVTRFLERVQSGRCVVERLIEGPGVHSPSAQGRISPDGTVTVVATHDQVLTGSVRQHFSGCLLPARAPGPLHDAARAVGRRLAEEGVVGWYGVDFLDVDGSTGREVYALEINIRNLGTVHHVLTLTGLLGGGYDVDTGRFTTADGRVRAYYGTDGVKLPALVGIDAAWLVRACSEQPWAYRSTSGTGVVLHMLDAARPYGRVGVTCIADSRHSARALFSQFVDGIAAVATGLR